jgi:DNA-binding NarL/FixJ family response regulator
MRLHWVRGGSTVHSTVDSTVQAHARDETLSVVVVAGTRVHREMLARSLDGNGGLRVLDSAATVQELTARVGAPPAIVLVDAAFADDPSTITKIVETLPESKVVVLSVPETDTDVIAFAEAGVAGFIPRDSSVEEMVACLRSAARDELLCSPRVAAILLGRVRSAARGTAGEPASASLTYRQLQILELIGEGLSNRAIAARLGIEVSTVKNHVHQILDRLQVHRRSEAAARLKAWNARSLVGMALLVTKGFDLVNGLVLGTAIGIPF